MERLEQRLVLSHILHVDADALPGGSGDTWDEALVSLQAALDRAELLGADPDPDNDITDIWIAEGTYRPTRQSVVDSPRSETFQPLDGVALRGSFAGTEDSPEDRARKEDRHFLHETILTGDLLGNDDPADETTFADNAYTVVLIAGADVETIIDGLTITGGRSTESHPDHLEWDRGGGIYNYRGTMTVSDSTVSGNSATATAGGSTIVSLVR